LKAIATTDELSGGRYFLHLLLFVVTVSNSNARFNNFVAVNSKVLYHKLLSARLISRSDWVAFALFAAIFIGQTSILFETEVHLQKSSKLCYREAAPSSQSDLLQPSQADHHIQTRSFLLSLRPAEYLLGDFQLVEDLVSKSFYSVNHFPREANHLILRVFRI
jgi:hypothetical protein